MSYFRNVKAVVKYCVDNGIPEGKVDGVSNGDNGFYLFYINSDNKIVKIKACRVGVTYYSKEDADLFINNYYNQRSNT